MSYAQRLLADGESIVLRTRQHPLALVIHARNGIALWLVAILLVFAGWYFRIAEPGAQIIGWAAIASLLVGLAIVLWQYLLWLTEEYLITNRRLMKVNGVINKRSSDSSLEKINDAILSVTLWGRLFNYGDLDILTAADQTVDSFEMLNGARDFKRALLNQKHALEMEYAGGRPTAPPLRAGAMDMHGEFAFGPSAGQEQTTVGEGASSSAVEPDVRRARIPPPPPPPPLPSAVAPVSPTPSVSAAPASESTAEESRAGQSSAVESAGESTASSAGQPARDTALEITRTLARLADLRDRGAISEADYQQKKDELLARL
ncbi:MAG: PH domain-containing protein [Chloroflexota bacterium]|nr:PH domain-containing protein [Chloroflexota bacterium]